MENCYISVCWVPSHAGLEGTENVNKVAKEAVSSPRSIDHLLIQDIMSYMKSVVRKER